MGKTDTQLFDMKKALIYAGLVAAFILIPTILVSGPMFSVYQGWIDHHQETGFAKWLEWKMGRIAGLTLREDRAADCFDHYIRYWAEQQDLDIPGAYYWWAFYLTEGDKKEEAQEACEYFLANWGEDNPWYAKVYSLYDRIRFTGNR